MKFALSLLASTLLLATAVPALAAGSLAPRATVPGAAKPGDPSPKPPTNNTTTDDTSTDDTSTDDTTAPSTDGVSARDPQSVLDALQAAGYPGKLEKMDSGRTSIAVKISGLNTFIDFYDCADDLTDCYTLLFNVSLDLKKGTTMAEANTWNSQQITGRVWLDKNSDPTLDYSLSTFNGIPSDAFEQNLKLWDTKIGDFKDFFHF